MGARPVRVGVLKLAIRVSLFLALLAPLLLSACLGRQLAPEFRGIDGWINSRPLTLEALRGKVGFTTETTNPRVLNGLRSLGLVSQPR